MNFGLLATPKGGRGPGGFIRPLIYRGVSYRSYLKDKSSATRTYLLATHKFSGQPEVHYIGYPNGYTPQFCIAPSSHAWPAPSAASVMHGFRPYSYSAAWAK